MSEIQGKPVYGVCACKEKVQVLSVDQVADLIQQMAANDWQVPEDYIPQTSINGIIEQNSKDQIRLWVGTQAEYDVLTTDEKNSTFAIITDDPTLARIESDLSHYGQSIENINKNVTTLFAQQQQLSRSIDEGLNSIEERLTNLGFKEGSITFSDAAQTYIDTTISNVRFQRQGNYVIGIIQLQPKNHLLGHAFLFELGTIPIEFRPKIQGQTVFAGVDAVLGVNGIEYDINEYKYQLGLQFTFNNNGTLMCSNTSNASEIERFEYTALNHQDGEYPQVYGAFGYEVAPLT